MNLTNLIICGTGGYARECYQWVQDVIKQNPSMKFKGFLGPENNIADWSDLNSLYLGSQDNYIFDITDSVIVGVGSPKLRKNIYYSLKQRNVNLFNLIHPSVIIGRNCKIGDGNIFCPNSVLTCDILIGNGNNFNLNVTIGHDAVIGNFNVVSSHCDITGNTRVGDENLFGSNVSILPRARIGSLCKIAAGSVVYKGFSDNAIASGNPARKI